MSKKNKPPVVADETSVAKDRNEDPKANSNLADFAKEKTAKEAKAKTEKTAAAKVNKDGRPKLPPLPRKAGSPKPLVACACGCGMQTRSRFAPGHDSRLRGWALRIARNIIELKDIPDGERQAVEAHIKQLKKEGRYEALKSAQPVAKKKVAAAAE